jgi:hypothetical protein
MMFGGEQIPFPTPSSNIKDIPTVPPQTLRSQLAEEAEDFSDPGTYKASLSK